MPGLAHQALALGLEHLRCLCQKPEGCLKIPWIRLGAGVGTIPDLSQQPIAIRRQDAGELCDGRSQGAIAFVVCHRRLTSSPDRLPGTGPMFPVEPAFQPVSDKLESRFHSPGTGRFRLKALDQPGR